MTISASAAVVKAASPDVSNNNNAPEGDNIFVPENGAKIIIAMNRLSNDHFGFNQNAINSEIVVSLSGKLESILNKLYQGLKLYADDLQFYDPVVVIAGSYQDWTNRTVNLKECSIDDIIDYVRTVLTKPENKHAFKIVNPSP